MADPRVTTHPVTRVGRGAAERFEDAVAVERPLEIRVDGRPLAVTLRTPGDDEDLTIGFLAGEQVVRRVEDVAALVTREAECAEEPDLAEVRLAAGVPFDWSKLERHFASSSACGLCGRAHLESLRAGLEPLPVTFRARMAALAGLSARLRTAQSTFTATGGLHAAAWCTGQDLEPECLREDVGRHNAVDKVAGWLMRANRYPAREGVLWVSGRAGAEIVLKAARARMPLLAAVGAPSSLAIALAEAAGLTLVGFLREGRMNVYCGEGRIAA
jgi:FdhD protein